MTDKLKSRVRERMRQTGESYMVARHAVMEEDPNGWRCQFCGRTAPRTQWEKINKCPHCGREYDAQLAQDGDDEP